MVAITHGVDASDVVVMRPAASLRSLPPGAIIGTSSPRRAEAVKTIRDDLAFVALRGDFDQRVQRVLNGDLDGIVAPEAAIIRLKLTHLNREPLSNDTAPLQGKLAVLAREGDVDMETLFQPMDSRCPQKPSCTWG